MVNIKNFDKEYSKKHITAHERALLKREMRNANSRISRMYEKYQSSELLSYSTMELNKYTKYNKNNTQWDFKAVTTDMTYSEYYQVLKAVKSSKGISDYELMVLEADPIYKELIKKDNEFNENIDEYSTTFIKALINFTADMNDVLKDLSSPSLGKSSDDLGISFMKNSKKSADEIQEAIRVITEYKSIKSNPKMTFEDEEEYLNNRKKIDNDRYTNT